MIRYNFLIECSYKNFIGHAPSMTQCSLLIQNRFNPQNDVNQSLQYPVRRSGDIIPPYISWCKMNDRLWSSTGGTDWIRHFVMTGYTSNYHTSNIRHLWPDVQVIWLHQLIYFGPHLSTLFIWSMGWNIMNHIYICLWLLIHYLTWRAFCLNAVEGHG